MKLLAAAFCGLLFYASSTFGATFSFTNEWQGGGQAAIRIINDTGQPTDGWTLEFDWDASITSIWNATIQSRVGNHYIIGNMDYNAVIAPNGIVDIGCVANYAPAGIVATGLVFRSGASAPVLAISTATISQAGVGTPYSATLAATGGTPPYIWSIASGSLPNGLVLAANGNISGVASQAGISTFAAQVVDSVSSTTTRSYSLTVSVLPNLRIEDARITLDSGGGSAPPNAWLSTAGNQIVDASGQAVRISGVNWFGFETGNGVLHGLWSRGYKSVLDQIKQLGFNTLRLPFSNEMLKAGATTNSINYAQNPDLQGLTPIQCMDKIIAYCSQIGLKVILDRHSAKADNYLSEDVWYIAGDSYYTESRWIQDWVLLANRYANDPTIIGADLFNEPKRSATWGTTSPATDWNKAAERCGNAILAANPNWLIIVEGVERYNNQTTWWGGNLKGVAVNPVVLSVPNKLVYSMHDYPKSVYAQTWFNDPTYPNNLDDVWQSHWGYIFLNQTAPLLLGEFGTNYVTLSDQQWLDKLTDYIDGDFNLDGTRELGSGQMGMSWTYWSLNPNSGDTGGILADDWTTVNTSKMAAIQASLAPLIGSGAAPTQTMTFPVNLSAAASGPVTVSWTTSDGSAIAGTNYLAASGTLTFAVGEVAKSIPIAIPSQTYAGPKQFTVRLATASGAVLANATATGTIQRCPADGNSDGIVNGNDLSLFMSSWGAPSVFDFNNDGTTNGSDLTTLLQDWGNCQ